MSETDEENDRAFTALSASKAEVATSLRNEYNIPDDSQD